MANSALIYKRALAPLFFATMCAFGLMAGNPTKEVHRRSVYDCPKFSGPTEKYVVQKGDLLSCIATWSGTTVCKLAEVNHICNPDVILPGEVLIVPGGKKSTTVVVPCVLNKHNHPSTANMPNLDTHKHPEAVSSQVAPIDWASLLRLRISVEVQGDKPPRVQVTPIMFVPVSERMEKADSIATGEWKTIRVGNDEYRVRVTIPEVTPTATAQQSEVLHKETPAKEIPNAKVKTDLNAGPDVKTYFASENK